MNVDWSNETDKGGTMSDKTFKIEKNVPMPEGPRSYPKGKLRYPFSDMNIKDSFLVKDANVNKISAAARLWGARHGVKFVIRTVADGIRVWRIA